MFESNMLNKRSRCLHHHLGYGKLHIIVIMNSQSTARQALYSSAKREGENEATKNIAASSEAEIYQVLFYPGSLPAVT